MAKSRKKTRTHVPVDPAAAAQVPKSFIIKSGPVSKSLAQLVLDLRKVMEPNTAANLKERKTNKLRDFIHIASTLSVTHLLLLTQSETSPNLRICRLPHGPTLTFHIKSYSLIADVAASLACPSNPSFRSPPILILNGFQGGKEVDLVQTMLTGLIPEIQVGTMRLEQVKRVLVVNWVGNKGPEDGTESTKKGPGAGGDLEIRVYGIKIKVGGMGKVVKRVMKQNIPDLGNYQDIADYILKEAQTSDSEHDEPGSTFTAPEPSPLDPLRRGPNKRDPAPPSQQRSVRLVEIGPRVNLSLIKIQSGVCDGPVLFHSYIHKTPQEVKALEAERQAKEAARKQRRSIQEANVERKKVAAEAEALGKRKRRGNPNLAGDDADLEDQESGEEGEDEVEDEFEDEVEQPTVESNGDGVSDGATEEADGSEDNDSENDASDDDAYSGNKARGKAPDATAKRSAPPAAPHPSKKARGAAPPQFTKPKFVLSSKPKPKRK